MTIAVDIVSPGQTLEDTLRAHGVKAIHMTDFNGPTVVQHAFALESGVKVAKVEAMSKDLALALGLDDVRIVAPIPGTSYVGVEVPRENRETVTYADINDPEIIGQASDQAWTTGALPFPVGVSIGGDAIWADLAKLPHLLVAGATGSGKSVALNSLLTSLIDHKTSDELRLWLIDPKRVELGIFERAPQVERIATDIRDAVEVLESVVDIMDFRYTEFEKTGVRNITEYNDEQALDDQQLPYHVVVIDELADLMMQAKKEVEPLIVRLAQLARAAGIHLVLATQRPTVDVVTGLIAGNIVSRWSFAVRSAVDSKVILEQTGAQALYGHGDSLWYPAGAAKPLRVQGVWTDPVTLNGILDAAEDGTPNVVSSASPNAVADDDDYDLADHGVPVDNSSGCPCDPVGSDSARCPNSDGVPLCVPKILPNVLALGQEVARENLRDLAITDDSTGLGTTTPPKHRDESVVPVVEVVEDVDFEGQEALAAELEPVITELVNNAIDGREAAKEARQQARIDALDAKWRRYVLKPACWIAGGTATLWIVGRIVGA